MWRVLMFIFAASLIAAGCDDPDTAPTTRPSPTASRISVTAFPTTVLRSGSDATITARVTDDQGGNLEGTPVTFSTTSGTLSAATATTSSLGNATVTLSASDAARVTANAAGLSGDVDIGALSPFSLSLSRPSQVFTDGATFDVDVLTNRDAINPPRPIAVTLHCGFGDTVDITATQSTRCVFPSAGEFTVEATARAANGWTTTDSARVTAVSRTGAPPASSTGTLTVTVLEISRGSGFAEWRLTATANVAMENVEFDFGDQVKETKIPDGDRTSASVQHVFRPALADDELPSDAGVTKTYTVTVRAALREGRPPVTVTQPLTVTVD